MRRFLALLLVTCTAVSAADRPIILVTPQGVWQSVPSNGVPGPWTPLGADVIVQGFDTGAPAPPVPPGPGDPSDPIVEQIAALTTATVANKEQALALATTIESLQKYGLTGSNFVQALEMSVKIIDTSMGASGKLIQWAEGAIKITTDPTKLKAGVIKAFDLSTSQIHAVAAAVDGQAPTAEALDFAEIIAIIKMVIELLQQLGIL